MSKVTSINLIESTVSRDQAREFIEAWANKKKLGSLDFIKEGWVYYPFYYGETLTTIKRIFPLPPRKVRHRWLLDAITGRPFMLPNPPQSEPVEPGRPSNILKPVIDQQGAAENIKNHLPRIIMRYYKYFFTPAISTGEFSLFYIKVWLFNFRSSKDPEAYLGVNSWSGYIMELEEK